MKRKINHDSLHKRLSIIKGQVEGIARMLEGGDYCIDVIHQSRAVQQSLKNFDRLLLEQHLQTCATDMIKSANVNEREKAIKELMTVYSYK